MKTVLYFVFFFCTCIVYTTFGQTGLTVGPPRVFFVVDAGQSQTQYVDVTNPSKDYTLELAVSLEDWEYSELGDNIIKPKGSLRTSCADWLSISETFFALRPGESKRLQVNMQVPKEVAYSDATPVHTAMLFVTQLNPRAGAEHDGANIRLAVRAGMKVYHRFNGQMNTDLEITNLKYTTIDQVGKFLELSYDVTGNTWMEGQVRAEFINQDNGKKTIIEDLAFYCLPHDRRKQYIPIPQELVAGDYIATVMLFYGDQNLVKAAELEFNYE